MGCKKTGRRINVYSRGWYIEDLGSKAGKEEREGQRCEKKTNSPLSPSLAFLVQIQMTGDDPIEGTSGTQERRTL